MKIGLAPLPEPGHVNATLRLFRELVARGHEVMYVSTEQHEPLFRQRGLPVSLAEQRLPSDASDAQFALGGFTPELMLIDSVLPHVAMQARQQGVKVVNLSTTFALGYDPHVPPLSTALRPSDDPAQRAEIELAWACERERHRRPLIEGFSRMQMLRATAEAFQFPVEMLDDQSALEVTVRGPEIILAPAELDFPSPLNSRKYYAGACVELDRAEELQAELSHLCDRPLVYCSLGSQVHRYAQLGEAVPLLMHAARSAPDFQFVVAGLKYGGPVETNVRVLERAPQLTLLRHASLMLSHGGLNGIKEALCVGVPLIVLPFDQDQPGNAARVAFNGLGRHLRWSEVDPNALVRQVREVRDDTALRQRVARLSLHLNALHERHHAAETLARCVRDHYGVEL
jgi:zeaxanthin glucosyltransferase